MMLNTDAHNANLKKKMTKLEFFKMNRGINDGSDLPEELLSQVYDEVTTNEIAMDDEAEKKALQTQSKTSGLASVGRDLQKEAYITKTSGMSSKTEVRGSCC
jgi:brefeldin A-inhibited guanine nucleotide-exchange protein